MNDKSDYFAQLEANIDKHGFHVTCVNSNIAYCYTVGMSASFGLPELFISSLPPNLSHELTHQYLDRYRSSKPEINQVIEKQNERFDFMLILVDNDAVAEHALSTFECYPASEITFLQLVYPDTKSKFPHQSGYDYDQEILGIYPENVG